MWNSRFVQGTCQEIEGNRHWHSWLFRKDMVWHLRPTEASYPDHIASSFGPPLSMYCPTCAEKLIQFWQTGEKTPLRAFGCTRITRVYQATGFTELPCVTVTTDKVPLELPTHRKAGRWLVLKQWRQNRVALLLSPWGPNRTSAGKLCYSLTIRLASYFKSVL